MLPTDTYAIALTARDEEALEAIRRQLSLRGVAHVACYEPDAPFNGALVSIGLVPDRKEVLRRFVSSLPLLR